MGKQTNNREKTRQTQRQAYKTNEGTCSFFMIPILHTYYKWAKSLCLFVPFSKTKKVPIVWVILVIDKNQLINHPINYWKILLPYIKYGFGPKQTPIHFTR